MTKIKICGLRRAEDIAYVNECQPDYVGFVFADSRRKVAKEQAKMLKRLLKPDIVTVGVFVNEDVNTVAKLVNEGIIEIAQLHGEEDETYIAELRALTGGVAIIKAVRVATEEDVKQAENLSADYLLFDTFSKKEYGGTGKTFEWDWLREVERPFFLAGGIGSYNVKEAVEKVKPYAIDVSSAVETDGFKDREKIIDIVTKVRNL